MNKTSLLKEIAKEIEICKICKEKKSGKAVVGEGNADANAVFIGEAPGRAEAATGRPFVGRSGKLLRSLINEVGLREENIYITSPVKYLPDRRTPSTSDIEHGRIHLMDQLKIIDPKLIVLLGSVAIQGVLGEKRQITKEHGTTINKEGKTYFLTYHPSAALRFPPLRKLIIEDFEKLKLLVTKMI